MNSKDRDYRFTPRQQELLDKLKQASEAARARDALLTPAEREAQEIALAKRDRKAALRNQKIDELEMRVHQYEAAGNQISYETWVTLPPKIRLSASLARRARERKQAL